LRGLTVGVEYPEGSVDPDPEGVGPRICLRVERFECKTGDGNGFGRPFEDLVVVVVEKRIYGLG